MSLVFACIAPHGGDIVAEIAEDPAVMAQTRAAMEELGRRCAAAKPDTVVVLDPHGFAVAGAISLTATPVLLGAMGSPAAPLAMGYGTDLPLAQAILDHAEFTLDQVPFLPLTTELLSAEAKDYLLWLDGDSREIPAFRIEWGSFIPLWFLANHIEPRPNVLVLTPDPSLRRETLVRAGVAIARAAAKSDRRIALIASCDQGHAHDAAGPYGFDPGARAYDEAMCRAVGQDDLASLLKWPADFLETAKVDSYWQTLMLLGALGHTPMTPELLSYEAPTYFGMLVAAYAPA